MDTTDTSGPEEISISLADLTRLLTKGLENITKKVDGVAKDVGDIKKQLEKDRKELPTKVAEEVSMQVVGESYYRWDSVSTYFPTLSFLFREINVGQDPRRTQIKVRLKKRNEEIGEAEIGRLKASCAALSNLMYTYETVRANYVSQDKRFKTTVFCKDPSAVKRVLDPICEVIGEPYESRNLSITTARNRSNTTKRTTPLAGVPINTVSYQTTITVKLYKVVLLVNGLSSPIVIYKTTLQGGGNE